MSLPRLGGSELLRGYDTDRFRDRIAALGSVQYRWQLHQRLSAYLFTDTGRVYRDADSLTFAGLRLGYGGGLELGSGSGFVARAQLASSIDGGPVLQPDAGRPLQRGGTDGALLMRRWLATVVLLAASGCAHLAPDPPMRFQNRAIVWRVNDRRDIPRPRHLDFYSQELLRQLTHQADHLAAVAASAAAGPEHQRPRRGPRLDLVHQPDRPVRPRPEDIIRGPEVGDSPEAHLPWTIVSTRRGGAAPTFVID